MTGQSEFLIAKSLPAVLCLAGPRAVQRAPLHWEELGPARADCGRGVVWAWGSRLPSPSLVTKHVLWK